MSGMTDRGLPPSELLFTLGWAMRGREMLARVSWPSTTAAELGELLRATTTTTRGAVAGLVAAGFDRERVPEPWVGMLRLAATLLAYVRDAAAERPEAVALEADLAAFGDAVEAFDELVEDQEIAARIGPRLLEVQGLLAGQA